MVAAWTPASGTTRAANPCHPTRITAPDTCSRLIAIWTTLSEISSTKK